MATPVSRIRWSGIEKPRLKPQKPRDPLSPWEQAREIRKERRAEARRMGTLVEQPRMDGFIVVTDPDNGSMRLKWAGFQEWRRQATTRQAHFHAKQVSVAVGSKERKRRPKKNSSDAGESIIGSRA